MTSVPFADDPVWTPLDPKSGAPWFDQVGDREPLASCRAEIRSLAGADDDIPVARWDAEQPGWVIAPPAPVEVTGVPTRWVVISRRGYTFGQHASEQDAFAAIERIVRTNYCDEAPFSVEACIPIEQPEEAS